MLDVRCKVQDTHHVFAAHSSRLTALSNNTITLPRVWKLNISQGMINLIWQEMITFRGCATVIQNCQLSSTTVIYNCHLQLSSTTAIHWAATIASIQAPSIQAPNHSAWSTASSPWHAKQQRHWGSCACSAGAFLRSLVSKRQSLQTCPETKIIDNWQASCAEVGPSNSWHRWGLHNCTLPVQALPWLTANEGKGCFY